MIKKLRNKFILITMLLITAVLIAVFVVMLASNYNIYKQECHDELMRAIDNVSAIKDDGSPPSSDKGRPASMQKPSPAPSSTPKNSSSKDNASHEKSGKKKDDADIFIVIIDNATHEIISTNTYDLEITKEQINTALSAALSSSKGNGVIHSLSLRYMSRSSSSSTTYAFADITEEINALSQQMLVMLFSGVIGLIAFFLITLLLSNIAIRPTEQAYTQQKQFIADASHELRTPLTVILANTSILSKSLVNTDEQKWIDSTYTEALHMKQLVDDMLFLARSDAEQTPIEKSDVDLSDIVWSASLPFESVLLEKKVELDTDAISSDVHLFGNETQLKQLVTLLMDNACKYVDSGGKVTVKLYCDNDKAFFEVNNTGAVISDEDIDHIFERFYRADKVRSYMGGHGLGLSIADRIVNHHKGKITVSSSSEHGTTFTVSFHANSRSKRSN